MVNEIYAGASKPFAQLPAAPWPPLLDPVSFPFT